MRLTVKEAIRGNFKNVDSYTTDDLTLSGICGAKVQENCLMTFSGALALIGWHPIMRDDGNDMSEEIWFSQWEIKCLKCSRCVIVD